MRTLDTRVKEASALALLARRHVSPSRWRSTAAGQRAVEVEDHAWRPVVPPVGHGCLPTGLVRLR